MAVKKSTKKKVRRAKTESTRINAGQAIFAELDALTEAEKQKVGPHLVNWLMENGLY